MTNLLTISGATLWVAVVFTLMLVTLMPVSVAAPTDAASAIEENVTRTGCGTWCSQTT